MSRDDRIVTSLLVAAALYDGILGLLFLLTPGRPFVWFDVTPPNHAGYVQFPAALLLVFASMFWQAARQPGTRRILIPYGILLKTSYSGVVFWHWATTGIPWMWKPFAVVDLAFAAALAWAWNRGRTPA